MITLTQGATLQSGKYEIIKILGQGGFGITYLVLHTLLDTLFCIKEFFPQDYCNRDSSTSRVLVATQSNVELVSRLKTRFLSEARNLIKLKHPGIVAIHDIFEENGTAYFVMDYIEGHSLDDMVAQSGAIQEKKAVAYIKKVAEAVSFIHGHKITHFDIKPANVMIRASDGEPVLIDFGLSKQFNEQGHARSTLLMGVSHGFSPLEQYMQDGIDSFSPRSDIYSLGATLYFLVTGRVPPEAIKLAATTIEVPETVSPTTATAIKWAMQSQPENRCPSTSDFIRTLESKETATKLADSLSSASGRLAKDERAQKSVSNQNRVNVTVEDRKKPNVVAYVIGALTVIIVVFLGFWLLGGKSGSEKQYQPEDTVAENVSTESNQDPSQDMGRWVDGVNEFHGMFNYKGAEYGFFLKVTYDSANKRITEVYYAADRPGVKFSVVKGDIYLSQNGDELIIDGKPSDGLKTVIKVTGNPESGVYSGEMTRGQNVGTCTLRMNGSTMVDYLAANAIETSVNGRPAWYYQGYFSDGKRDYEVKLLFVKTGAGSLEAQYKNVEYNVAPMSMTVSDITDSEMTLYNAQNKFKIILHKGSDGDLYGRALQGKNDLSVRLYPTSSGF